MNRPTLAYGAEGEHVKVLQSLLRSSGMFDGLIGGNFKTKTKNSVIYFQQTHLGPNGENLEPDGIVGPATWWALDNPTGAPQRSYIDPRIPDGLSDIRVKILEKVLAEHRAGTKEVPDGANWGDGVTKFLVGVGPVYWCCYFYSWGLKEATGEYPLGKRHGHCKTLWEEAKEKGKAFLKNKYTPIPGDAFVLLFKNSSGRYTGAGHIGYVLSVSADGKYFNTVEGNAGNRVKVGTRSISESTLAGFINLHDQDTNFERVLLKGESTSSSTSGTR
jgi:hypothetical protein